mgnify:CR=1 FL=1
MLGILYTFLCNIFFLAGYIVNPNSFPQPLTPEEEEQYLREYHDGDESKKDLLIEHNLRLVAHVVKKYITSGKDMDDLISIGTIGLIKAVTSYNNKKGTRLATYAARCIENAIVSQWLSVYKKVNLLSPMLQIGIYSPKSIVNYMYSIAIVRTRRFSPLYISILSDC